MRRRLVLDALDELDPVVDQVRVEVLDLLLRELDLLEARDDLVVAQEALLEALGDELVQLFDIRQRDIDGQHFLAFSLSPDNIRCPKPKEPGSRPEPPGSHRIPPECTAPVEKWKTGFLAGQPAGAAWARRPSGSPRTGARPTGRSRKKVEPPPGLETTQIRPSMRRTSSRQM